MALQVFKISDYSHIAENKQFESLVSFLEAEYKDSEELCYLIGNFNIEGVELDALLITAGGIRILEFKNYGGHILARENGPWKAGDIIIEGGSGDKSPYEQIRMNRSKAVKGLKKVFSKQDLLVSAAIIFWQDSDIDLSQISESVKKWLHVCDNSHIGDILIDLCDTSYLSTSMLQEVSKILNLSEFDINNVQDSDSLANETYAVESSSDFYDELENALGSKPNYPKVYSVFNKVFQRFIEQNIANTRLNLSGTFAKVNYLLKEHQASRNLVKKINDTRVRLRKRAEMSDADLEKWYCFDFRNLCMFISFISGTNIPKTLLEKFPKQEEQAYHPKLTSECIRVIVKQWSENIVYCLDENNTEDDLIAVKYTGGVAYDFDWSYLRKMFYEDAQMNLIRPRMEDGIYYPELIVFEPDYLINISTIARCFTNYAESPFVNLISTLQEQSNTEATQLGQFAGQLLDEEIHQVSQSNSYNKSALEFWKKNALGLLTANTNNEFHENAKLQKQNIATAMRIILPQALGRFDTKEGMVEPSFYSEMLGLQGRMDYLQLDYRFLLEQKSGKGEYPYANFIKPKHTEEHYVQLLLYMMLIRYNYRKEYLRNKEELQAFLLYTKYKESPLGLGFSPDLMFRALKVRNGLAWTDIQYGREEGIRILDILTPEMLNMKKVDNPLWTKFQLKQIKKVLDPIHEASELEKSYYYRFLTFIFNEHNLAKVGNKTKEDSGLAAIWQSSLEDKLQSGNIYDKLTLVSPNAETQGVVTRVRLSYVETELNDMSNFRESDIVILYAYEKDKEPDATKTMVFRGTIETLDTVTNTIDIALRASQSDSRVFLKEQGKLWAIEHDFMDSSFSSYYKGMQAFLSARKERRDIILLQKEPGVKEKSTLNGEYGEFNELVKKVKSAEDIFLIIGPPGTGKTSKGLLNVLKEELTEYNTNILLLSFTNRAVDEICSKLVQEDIDFLRLGGDYASSEDYRDKLLSQKAQNCSNKDELEKLILTTRVFVSTIASMNLNLNILSIKNFSLAIVDEASQVLEPHLMSILSAKCGEYSAIKKFVFIGDHKQLPAVVRQSKETSKVIDIELNKINLLDCRESLFERLHRKFHNNPDLVYMLKKQGRMHPEIALFPNYTFYCNQLETVPLEHQEVTLPTTCDSDNGIRNLLCTRRICFINAESPTYPVSDKVNQVEADIIAATIAQIYELEKERFDVNETVGVIVPYRNQIAAIRKKLNSLGNGELAKITIDTVERYQGSQRKYIIYGFTIQKYYQLKFLTSNVFEDPTDETIVDRKLNVAITRAKEHLILVGNACLLNNNFTFYKLLRFVKSKHGYFDIPSENYIKGNFEVPPYESEPSDLSKASFTTSDEFSKAFNNIIIEPLKLASGENWPNKVLGYDMSTNLNIIGYGRIDFSKTLLFRDKTISPKTQTLIYGYYIMRQHYCSSKNIYQTYQETIKADIEAYEGRLRFIDIGCGPATCGIAFSELFLQAAPNMFYVGIDKSTAMKELGRDLITHQFGNSIYYQMHDSFKSLDDNFWEICSELSSLVYINISYFFSNISTQFAEQLAEQIIEVVKERPLNKYVIIIQQSEHDYKLASYNTFRRILSAYMHVLKEERASFSYTLNQRNLTLPFCYTIITS